MQLRILLLNDDDDDDVVVDDNNNNLNTRADSAARLPVAGTAHPIQNTLEKKS
jgi:hypothetical protein